VSRSRQLAGLLLLLLLLWLFGGTHSESLATPPPADFVNAEVQSLLAQPVTDIASLQATLRSMEQLFSYVSKDLEPKVARMVFAYLSSLGPESVETGVAVSEVGTVLVVIQLVGLLRAL